MDPTLAARAGVVTHATAVARDAARIAEDLAGVSASVKVAKVVTPGDFERLCENTRALAILLGGAAYFNEIARTMTLWERIVLAVRIVVVRAG